VRVIGALGASGLLASVANKIGRLRPFPAGRLNEFPLKKVKAIRSKTIEHLLEVGDVPWFWKL
jgi:hypothetical protein